MKINYKMIRPEFEAFEKSIIYFQKTMIYNIF